MSDRLRNNLIAGLIVFAFWCVSFSTLANDPIITESTSTVTTNGNQTTKIESPPPSAIAPQFGGSNSDLCTISSSGSVQTQILGISVGATYTEENCLRLKSTKTVCIWHESGCC